MAITGLDRYSSGLHKAQGRRRDAVPVVRCPRFSGCHGSVYGANDCGAKRVTDFKMNILEACCRARRGAQYRRKGGQG
jgi:hypothetical protein